MVENNFSSKIELTFSAKNLVSNSLSQCIIYMHDLTTSRFFETGKTEFSPDLENPEWETKILVDYIFERKQAIRIIIQTTQLMVLGSIETCLGSLACESTSQFNLISDSCPSKLIVNSKEIKQEVENIVIQLRAHNVDKMDFFGKSDPYFIIYKKLVGESWIQVYKSEIIKKTLDPFWKPFEITSAALCNCDYSLPLRIECWDWDRGASDDFIGFAEVTLAQLSVPHSRFTLFDPAKHKKNPKKYKDSGTLEVENIQITKDEGFIRFLQTGTQLNTIFGIDFTSSNGDFKNKNSLHYFDPNFQNEYERAIMTIGNILEAYDKDKLFAAFGFGGEPNWTKKVEHCFPLNKNELNPYILSIDGVIQTYHQILSSLRLAGPTLFQFLIRTAMTIAQTAQVGETYYVLLILTDGEIHDMAQTITAIVDSSYLPISTLIVGVGLESFLGMEQLCKFPLKDDSGRLSARDNVQFIPFRSLGGNPHLLANALLSKIPSQVAEYMKLIRYQPLKSKN